MSQVAFNRRRFVRFALPAMYTPVSVKVPGQGEPLLGHAYDVGEGGVQFELDHAIRPGTAVTLEIDLPADSNDAPDADRSVVAVGNIVWLDDSEPGPVRMAMAFTRFESRLDKERLMLRIRGGRLRRAA